jgi:hypothetical protein
VAGGLSVPQVQEALNELKTSWETKAKTTRTETVDPFKAIKLELQGRLDCLNVYEAGGDMPEWLSKVQEASKLHAKKTSKKRPNMEQMARKEREVERSQVMKADLQKAQDHRRQLVQKLRQLKQKNELQFNANRTGTRKRRVQWKDGLGPTTKLRKRDILEEVFIIQSRAEAREEREEAVDDDDEAEEDLFGDDGSSSDVPDAQPKDENEAEEDLFGDDGSSSDVPDAQPKDENEEGNSDVPDAQPKDENEEGNSDMPDAQPKDDEEDMQATV